MPQFKFANFIATELVEGISAGATEMTIPTSIAAALPEILEGADEEIRLVLWDGQHDPEIVGVTENLQTGVMTITRAQEDTTARAWDAGTQVKCVLTAAIINAALEAFFDLEDVLQQTFLPLAGGTLTGPLVLDGSPVDPQQAATKSYVDAIGSGFLATTGGTMAGSINMGSNQILGLPPPAVASAAVNKAYVDSVAASSIKWKDPVRIATTANGTFSSAFDNGSTVDGVVIATNDRILIKDQTDGTQNGIYVVQASGSPVRATDADGNDEVPGATVFVEEGTANALSQWTCTNTDVVLGTTSLTFSLIAAGTTYSADNITLTLTGATFAVKSGGIGSTQMADDAITFAKMQNITTDRLLGRDTAGTGNVEEISLAAPLSWSGSGAIGVDAASTSAAGKVELATAAEVVTGSDAGRVPSVSVVKNHEGVAKAWVTFNSAGTIQDSYGVSSVSHDSTGIWTVTLSVTMANDSYATLVTAGTDDRMSNVTGKTTTTFTIRIENDAGTVSDTVGIVSAVVFGTLA